MINMLLNKIYEEYIGCLNRQEWVRLGNFVDDEVKYNGRPLHLSGYLKMLLKEFDDIPDLRFNIQFLITEPPRIAARLAFECSPRADFLGLSVNGRKISFGENVFYEFKNSKIVSVWSIIDKTSIEEQLLR